jgi:hypothetical protein
MIKLTQNAEGGYSYNKWSAPIGPRGAKGAILSFCHSAAPLCVREPAWRRARERGTQGDDRALADRQADRGAVCKPAPVPESLLGGERHTTSPGEGGGAAERAPSSSSSAAVRPAVRCVYFFAEALKFAIAAAASWRLRRADQGPPVP